MRNGSEMSSNRMFPELEAGAIKPQKKAELLDTQNLGKVDIGNVEIKKQVPKEATEELSKLMKLKEDELIDKYLLESVLKENIQEKLANIFSLLTPQIVKELYKSVENEEERAALELLLKEYEEKDQLEKEKKKEIQKVIRATKIELENFQGKILEQASYGNEHFREAPEKHFTTGKTETKTLSDTELKNLDTLLSDKNLPEGRLNKLERSLKSDFRKALVLANLPVKAFLSLLDQQKDQKI